MTGVVTLWLTMLVVWCHSHLVVVVHVVECGCGSGSGLCGGSVLW